RTRARGRCRPCAGGHGRSVHSGRSGAPPRPRARTVLAVRSPYDLDDHSTILTLFGPHGPSEPTPQSGGVAQLVPARARDVRLGSLSEGMAIPRRANRRYPQVLLRAFRIKYPLVLAAPSICAFDSPCELDPR